MHSTKIRKYLKGFTVAEMLVALVLISVSVTLSFKSLNYIQRLFYSYKSQNEFISKYISLNNKLNYESLKCEVFQQIGENVFLLTRDSIQTTLKLHADKLIIVRGEYSDTLFMQIESIEKEFEKMDNLLWTNRLICKLKFATDYTGQKFTFNFIKKHSSNIKLKLEMQ